jgi:DNA-binding Lrp family transcriptional regulator
MRKDALKKAKKILTFVIDYDRENHFQPSYREIAEKFHITAPMVMQLIDLLEEDGYVERFGASRAVKILKEVDDV